MRVDGFSLASPSAMDSAGRDGTRNRPGGFLDARILMCPSCRRRVYSLYHLDNQVVCRTCARLWYASQRRSANGRRWLRAQKIRLKLGGMKSLYDTTPDAFPPRPRGMHRKTYERLKRRDEWQTSR